MIYVLLFSFLLAQTEETTHDVARSYESQLGQHTKNQFFSPESWNGLTSEDQRNIRNILILKHAEMRYAPIDQMRLKVFDVFAQRINECSSYNSQSPIPSNPIFYWNIVVNEKFITSPLGGKYRCYDYDWPCRAVSKNKSFKIPYETNFNDGSYQIKETHTFDDKYLRVEGDFSQYLPFTNVHSICPLVIPTDGGYRLNSDNASGLLITLKNSLQMVWNRSSGLILPVGFINQKLHENDYEYCSRMHNRLFRMQQPAHFFDRLVFKTFIWQTPQWVFWARLKLSAVSGICIGVAYLGIKHMLR